MLDGLIVMKLRAYWLKFLLCFIIVLVVLGFVFKGLLLASIGNVAYVERVIGLAQGSVMDCAGAWVMQVDFVIVLIVDFLAFYLGDVC